MGKEVLSFKAPTMPRTLHVIATGGTIDKIYFDALSEFQVGEPALPAIFSDAGLNYPVEVTSLMRKDSLDLTDTDRDAIKQAIAASPADAIIVTHGTDTMAQTARHIGEPSDKTVIFVGAMQPASLKATDAVFNSGFALACAQLLPPGTYIAMNGEVFKPDEVRKDRSAGRFTSG
jgi:L-asparaginase